MGIDERSASPAAPSVVWRAGLVDGDPKGGFFRDGKTLGR